MSVIFDAIHRTLRGHWPVWEPYGYDFLSWSYRCIRCAR